MKTNQRQGITLTDAEHYAIERALRVAAEVYERDAEISDQEPSHAEFARNFRDQAAIARKLADQFEDSAP